MVETEPCPGCGRRIVSIKLGGGLKMCPVCRFRWFESGGGRRRSAPPPEDSGGAVAVAFNH